MLRSRKPAFRPSAYGYSRRKRRIPRWLMLMIVGIVIGVGGVLFVQESYGPARLTVAESERLHFDLNAATSEVQRLKTELGQSQRELNQTQEKQIGRASCRKRIEIADEETKSKQKR